MSLLELDGKNFRKGRGMETLSTGSSLVKHEFDDHGFENKLILKPWEQGNLEAVEPGVWEARRA